MFCHHKHSYVLNMAWNMHAQFIKNTTSINHAKALVPCTPNFRMALCHINFIYSQLLVNRYVSSWKFSFFFTMYPLFIVEKKPGGQMTVLYLLAKYLQTFYFLSVFYVLTTVFITYKKCITANHNSANSYWHIISNIEHINSLYWRFPDHTFW